MTSFKSDHTRLKGAEQDQNWTTNTKCSGEFIIQRWVTAKNFHRWCSLMTCPGCYGSQVAMARASILWLIGEYSEFVPKIAPDVLRKVAKTFVTQEDIVKLQIINLAAKLFVTNQKQVCVITCFTWWGFFYLCTLFLCSENYTKVVHVVDQHITSLIQTNCTSDFNRQDMKVRTEHTGGAC